MVGKLVSLECAVPDGMVHQRVYSAMRLGGVFSMNSRKTKKRNPLRKWGPFEWNLMVSAANVMKTQQGQKPMFFSWYFDQSAKGTDLSQRA